MSQLHPEFDFDERGLAAPPNSPASELGGASALIGHVPILSLDRLTIQEKKEIKPVMIVGISGSTSSGKSLLAAILAKVFDDALLMHQDHYFQPKALCPQEKFRSTANDLNFMHKSMTDDEVGQYVIISDGYAKSEVTIDGPDADCDEAIDFLTMLGMVARVVNSGELPNKIEKPGNPGEILGHPDMVQSDLIKHEFDLSSYENLIGELRALVAKKIAAYASANINNGHHNNFIRPSLSNGNDYTEEQLDITSMLPVICFVEGFLLFTDPEGPSNDEQKAAIFKELPTDFDIYTEQVSLRLKYQSIADLTYEIQVTEPNHDEYSEDARSEYEEEIWGKNIEAKYLLQSKFDLKLFLPTNKTTAMARRFSRPEYIDYPAGERIPGQMWKSEGYFENVAWKHYVEEHSWLLDQREVDDVECRFVEKDLKGVYVRPKADAGVEETARWAVDAILHRLCLVK
ncbi:hypothetical protein EG329_014193 [Mollisiaceae sp. DMI_Dod_QoI]|nr:hypothetical protein EG329_014193 [Helotiales sp. DMI_Dod_QoI]